ncbi:MAG: tRNA (adenosine(37)-N6)-dimethylallyltransferase MiaA [Sphingobacteriales bacterium]|nr:MAG: tRNA (adenosine(37)-N6)-dimethylallyltransferase MiaA [Sphingobacteriales bacterium]
MEVSGSSYPHTVYVIAGPTAVGKTGVAIKLARHLNTSILSADSRQCYKGMAIGTAQPSVAQQQEVKHYFINEFPVTDALTAADFESLSLQYLDEVFATNNTAVVVGGTGLYIKALCDGLDDMPDISEQVATEVNEHYRLQGLHWLQDAVHFEDPEFYAQAEVHNPARLLRALIFKRSTGESIIHFRTGAKKHRPFNIVKIGLELPREVLYEQINQRVEGMMQDGLVDEVKALVPYRHLKNLQTVGYTEVFEYLDGDDMLEEAITKIKQHTRNYAKRQMTWFKRDKEMTWLQADDEDIVAKITATKA